MPADPEGEEGLVFASTNLNESTSPVDSGACGAGLHFDDSVGVRWGRVVCGYCAGGGWKNDFGDAEVAG